jgi:hypothetical protein
MLQAVAFYYNHYTSLMHHFSTRNYEKNEEKCNRFPLRYKMRGAYLKKVSDWFSQQIINIHAIGF